MKTTEIRYWKSPDLIIRLPKNIYTPEELINKVSEVLNIGVEELKGRRRKREIVEARHIAMWMIVTHTDFKLEAIGRFFNRNHATIIYARNLVNGLLKVEDGELTNKVMAVRKVL